MFQILKVRFYSQDNKEELTQEEELYRELEKVLKQKRIKPRELSLVRSAYEFAKRYHEGQLRASNEPYIVHPLNVAIILAKYGLDINTIIAGLLHDTIEDTPAKGEDIEALFGKEVRVLVEGVTKASKIDLSSYEDRKKEDLIRVFLRSIENPKVLIIKLADRLHNVRTLHYIKNEYKRKVIAKETLDIYAKVAGRLGMEEMKRELEDRAFFILYPEEYKLLEEILRDKIKDGESVIKEAKEVLEKKLRENRIKARIYGRVKHLYSIYKKIKEQGRKIDDIYDFQALRIITKEVHECYIALGIVHSLWKPLHDRFKDFIASPKKNLYQSLHTTVIGPRNNLLEIQIRTEEMHRTAEYGIAAHWIYKEKLKLSRKTEDMLSWLNQIKLGISSGDIDKKNLGEDISPYLETNYIITFTPKGTPIELPVGATVLDFAYKIHTDLGYKCVGAFVNGVFSPIDKELKEGDVVFIKTSPAAKPTRKHLSIVKTQRAKSRIRRYLNKLSEMMEEVENRREEHKKEEKKNVYIVPKKKSFRICLKDLENVPISLASCIEKDLEKEDFCQYDRIAGYLSSNGYMSVHKIGCDNLKFLLRNFPERIRIFKYDGNEEVYKPVKIKACLFLKTQDRPGLLYNISNKISSLGIAIADSSLDVDFEKRALVYMNLYADNVYQFLKLRNALRSMPDVEIVKITKKRQCKSK